MQLIQPYHLSFDSFNLFYYLFLQKEIALYTASKFNSEFCWFDLDGDIDPLFKVNDYNGTFLISVNTSIKVLIMLIDYLEYLTCRLDRLAVNTKISTLNIFSGYDAVCDLHCCLFSDPGFFAQKNYHFNLKYKMMEEYFGVCLTDTHFSELYPLKASQKFINISGKGKIASPNPPQ